MRTGHTTRRIVFWARVAWWIVRLPLVITRGIYRLIGRGVRAWTLIGRDTLPCRGCGGEVSLVGRWQCSWCNYTFDGFAFAPCAVCGAVPPFMECQTCGVGIMNPTMFR